jgi:hypothetical protein
MNLIASLLATCAALTVAAPAAACRPSRRLLPRLVTLGLITDVPQRMLWLPRRLYP